MLSRHASLRRAMPSPRDFTRLEESVSSDAGLALPVDQDGSARRARGLHMMLVPAEVVRDVPVVHRWGRGYVRAPLHILRINCARCVTTHVRPHHRAAGCADARRKILPAATSDLM